MLAIALGPFDEKLLFPFMGDASKHAQQAQVSGAPLIRKLVCPGISKVVEFDSAPLELLKGWRGGLDRRPWMVLDVLKAALTKHKLKRFARAIICRLGAASQRRHTRRYAATPYSLYAHCLYDASEEDLRYAMPGIARQPT